jgi:hypothetical protein
MCSASHSTLTRLSWVRVERERASLVPAGASLFCTRERRDMAYVGSIYVYCVRC